MSKEFNQDEPYKYANQNIDCELELENNAELCPPNTPSSTPAILHQKVTAVNEPSNERKTLPVSQPFNTQNRQEEKRNRGCRLARQEDGTFAIEIIDKVNTSLLQRNQEEIK